ncbi:MAG: hypothetical protein AB4062_17980 [Crocosphaera sp.]
MRNSKDKSDRLDGVTRHHKALPISDRQLSIWSVKPISCASRTFLGIIISG